MKPRPLILLLPLAVLFLLTGSGCLNLKPKADPIRYFLLRPMAGAVEAQGPAQPGLRLGIAPVIVPSYLTKPWVVVRTSDTEIRYADYYKWAEYVDKGVQRVLAENLSYVLGTDQVLVNSWSREAVDVELKLMVQRFEVDTDGRVVLEALWQISGNQTSSGHHLVDVEGPAPAGDPAGAAETMSHALNELSKVLAAQLQD